MDFKEPEESKTNQQDEIERGFDFLESINTKYRTVKRKHSTWRYFFRYLKPFPWILFLALFFVFNVDSSGSRVIISEMQGAEKYIFAVIIILIISTVFALLAAVLFPPIIQCEFKDKSYKTRLEINLSDAEGLLKTVKTTENLKMMGAMIKIGVDNANDMSLVVLTLIASIGIFISSFPILIGLKFIDGGILAPLVGLAGVYLLNLLRLELTSQNLNKRIWLLIIETAQNLKSEQKVIIPAGENIVGFH